MVGRSVGQECIVDAESIDVGEGHLFDLGAERGKDGKRRLHSLGDFWDYLIGVEEEVGRDADAQALDALIQRCGVVRHRHFDAGGDSGQLHYTPVFDIRNRRPFAVPALVVTR